MSAKHDKIKIVIECDRKNTLKIFAYAKLLDDYVEKGNPIPAAILKKISSFFTLERYRVEQELKSQLNIIKASVVDKFTADKEYNFKKTISHPLTGFDIPFSMIDSTNNKVEYNLLKLVDRLFMHLVVGKFDRTNKKSSILFIYARIDEYLDPLKYKGLDIFSKYKRSVLTGFIMHKLGFALGKDILELEGEEPSNEMFEDAVKYYVPKNQKKKPKKKKSK